MSKLLWLLVLQPKKTLNLLISQYITGICGLPAKRVESKRSILHQVMVFAHTNMHCCVIYQEYREWLSRVYQLAEEHKHNLRLWVCLLKITINYLSIMYYNTFKLLK